LNDVQVAGDGSACVETHWFSESGVIDLFLLLGPTITSVFQQYRQLTGSTPLPPVAFAAKIYCQFSFATPSLFSVFAIYTQH